MVLPADAAWDSPGRAASPIEPQPPARVDDAVIDGIAAVLRSSDRTALLVAGAALRTDVLRLAGRIAAATGGTLYCYTFPTRLRRGAGEVAVTKLPYFAEQATEALDGVEHLVVMGTRAPVAFFAYPDRPSALTPPGCAVSTLTLAGEDGLDALARLADALDAPREPDGVVAAPTEPIQLPAGRLNKYSVGTVIARHLPSEAIVVDEAITSAVGPYTATANAPAHDHLALTGGAIGHGLPMAAAGAAVACPDRKVVCLHGDGGALYTLQALWTMAREQLDVTTVIFNNAAYAILSVELDRVGAAPAGEAAQSMLNLDRPALGWLALATGMGVDATRVSTVAEFDAAFSEAMSTPGPRLIDVRLAR